MERNLGFFEDLITDLIYLRKGDGFTPNRLRNATTLLEILGGSGQNFADLRVRFTSALNQTVPLPHRPLPRPLPCRPLACPVRLSSLP